MRNGWSYFLTAIEEAAVSDEMDRVQEDVEQFHAAALCEHRRRQMTGESLTHCEDCEKEIPEKRRLAVSGCRTCISCQEAREILSHWRVL